jgi:hypothetical protein
MQLYVIQLYRRSARSACATVALSHATRCMLSCSTHLRQRSPTGLYRRCGSTLFLFAESPREARSSLPQAVAEVARSLGAAVTISVPMIPLFHSSSPRKSALRAHLHNALCDLRTSARMLLPSATVARPSLSRTPPGACSRARRIFSERSPACPLPPMRLYVIQLCRRSARSAFLAAAGRRGGRPQLARRSDNLRPPIPLRSSTFSTPIFFPSKIRTPGRTPGSPPQRAMRLAHLRTHALAQRYRRATVALSHATRCMLSCSTHLRQRSPACPAADASLPYSSLQKVRAKRVPCCRRPSRRAPRSLGAAATISFPPFFFLSLITCSS